MITFITLLFTTTFHWRSMDMKSSAEPSLSERIQISKAKQGAIQIFTLLIFFFSAVEIFVGHALNNEDIHQFIPTSMGLKISGTLLLVCGIFLITRFYRQKITTYELMLEEEQIVLEAITKSITDNLQGCQKLM